MIPENYVRFTRLRPIKGRSCANVMVAYFQSFGYVIISVHIYMHKNIGYVFICNNLALICKLLA